MPINFDSGEFRRNLHEQFEYLLKNEASAILEEALNELVRERLEEVAHNELGKLAELYPEGTSDAIERLKNMNINLSSLDINHRILVESVLRKEMKKLLNKYIADEIK